MLLLAGRHSLTSAQPPATTTVDQSAPYMCPMHPDVRGKAGDTCRRCGMRLIPTSADYTPYSLDLDLTQRALRPNAPGRVRFFVRTANGRSIVRHFEEVHERIFHLFVVGRDLEYFAHIHPVLRPNGALDVDIAVPRPGPYQLIADFVPQGGAPQLVQRAFVTAGYTGPLGAVARPDTCSSSARTSARCSTVIRSPKSRRFTVRPSCFKCSFLEPARTACGRNFSEPDASPPYRSRCRFRASISA